MRAWTLMPLMREAMVAALSPSACLADAVSRLPGRVKATRKDSADIILINNDLYFT